MALIPGALACSLQLSGVAGYSPPRQRRRRQRRCGDRPGQTEIPALAMPLAPLRGWPGQWVITARTSRTAKGGRDMTKLQSWNDTEQIQSNRNSNQRNPRHADTGVDLALA